MSDERKLLGQRGEDAAAAYLERQGMQIVERNWRCRSGEVDIVALDDEVLVLCEVKTRKSVARGSAEEAITPAKQKRYARIARAYLSENSLADIELRFDAIAITVIADDRALLRHHRAAFTSDGE